MAESMRTAVAKIQGQHSLYHYLIVPARISFHKFRIILSDLLISQPHLARMNVRNSQRIIPVEKTMQRRLQHIQVLLSAVQLTIQEYSISS
jgi:hypothetical protein